jgi:hypothetical protein
MPIKIVDNFQINISNPIDNRFVVGSPSLPTWGAIYPTPFYSQRNDIVYKYPGLRIWDFNDDIPYVWDGTQWINENTTGATVLGSGGTAGTGYQNYITKFYDNQTVLTKSLMFDDYTHVSLGSVGTVNPNGPAGNAASYTEGIHVRGRIRTNKGFVGIGEYITNLNAGAIDGGVSGTGRLQLQFISTSGTNGVDTFVLTNNGSTSWQNILNVVPFWEPTNIGISNSGAVSLYSGQDISNNYYEFFSLISSGLNITDGVSGAGSVRIETKPGLNIGGGSASIYAGLDSNNVHQFKTISSNNLTVTNTSSLVTIDANISSSTLQITSGGGLITIEVPATFQGTDYYVNGAYYGAEELGTISKPFRTLKACIDKILNRGAYNDPTLVGPDAGVGGVYEKWEVRTGLNNGSTRVVIQSYCETDENLAINRVTYFLEKGGYNSYINVLDTGAGGLLEWIIDMEPLATNAPKTIVPGQLDYAIECSLIGSGTVGFAIGHTARKGFFRAKGTNSSDIAAGGWHNTLTNGAIPEQNDCFLYIGGVGSEINLIMYENPTISYTTLTDENGTAIQRESTIQKGVVTTAIPTYGTIQVEGRNGQFYESIFLGGTLTINAQEQHMIYLKDGGAAYADSGRFYMRRNYQTVVYSAIEYKIHNTPGPISNGLVAGTWYRVANPSGSSNAQWLAAAVSSSWRTSAGVSIAAPATVTAGMVFKASAGPYAGSGSAGQARKVYLPSNHVYDVYIKNGSQFTYGGEFYTQQNTGANAGGPDSFVCLENNTTDLSKMCSFAASGGGSITNMLYNSYFKSSLNAVFGDYQHHSIICKNLRIDSSVYKSVLNMVTSTGLTWNNVTGSISFTDCYFGDYMWYSGTIRLPFSNMVVNSKLFITGTLVDLYKGFFNSNLPNYTNDAAAAADTNGALTIGGIYRDNSGFLKVRIA